MQTFMPMIKYQDSVAALDDRRLNNQINECIQLFKYVTKQSMGYQSHPATLMWRGHEFALLTYGASACRAWYGRKRGQDAEYHDPRQQWFYETHVWLANGNWQVRARERAMMIPPWVGDLNFHRSHRSNLIRKDPQFYCNWGDIPENMPYLWPRDQKGGGYGLYVSNADRARLKSGERKLPEWLEMGDDGEVIDLEDEG